MRLTGRDFSTVDAEVINQQEILIFVSMTYGNIALLSGKAAQVNRDFTPRASGITRRVKKREGIYVIGCRRSKSLFTKHHSIFP
jgi:hypothetical protein